MDSGRYIAPQARWDNNSVRHTRSDVVSSLFVYRMLIPLVSKFNGSYDSHTYITPIFIYCKQAKSPWPHLGMDVGFNSCQASSHIADYAFFFWMHRPWRISMLLGTQNTELVEVLVAEVFLKGTIQEKVFFQGSLFAGTLYWKGKGFHHPHQ